MICKIVLLTPIYDEEHTTKETISDLEKDLIMGIRCSGLTGMPISMQTSKTDLQKVTVPKEMVYSTICADSSIKSLTCAKTWQKTWDSPEKQQKNI